MTRRVLIVGGGSGGTILANSLRPRDFDVTLITASTAHLFQPALLYVAFAGAGTHIVRDERKLLKRHVHLVHDRVTAVDFSEQTVLGTGGNRYDYDDLVLASGIETDPGQIPGLGEMNARFGDFHSSIPQAEKLSKALEAFDGGTLAVGQSTPICKCPPSPLEGILLADRLLRRRHLREQSRLIFFTPYPRPYPAEAVNEIVEPLLAQRGIEVMTFFDVDRVDPATGTITSIEGEQIQADLPLVIPPFMGADIAYNPADVLDPSRFLVTDRATLRVKGFDHVFAIGDATNLPTSKSGVGAHLEAKVVAEALGGRPSVFSGRTHCPFDLGDGRGTFVTSTFQMPAVRTPPSRLKHLMKMTFARLYWVSLRGALDPVFDVYFRLTDPGAARYRARPPEVPVG